LGEYCFICFNNNARIFFGILSKSHHFSAERTVFFEDFGNKLLLCQNGNNLVIKMIVSLDYGRLYKVEL
jgi:hypothetical protein